MAASKADDGRCFGVPLGDSLLELPERVLEVRRGRPVPARHAAWDRKRVLLALSGERSMRAGVLEFRTQRSLPPTRRLDEPRRTFPQ
jgi:hypothetical protein